MANFMGPMAPPQAAQPQPQALDVRTNPAQRAQFKSFMSSMSAPVMPTTAPVAPMLPAPNPMDQIDIFDPVQTMASGGVVGGLQDLGKMSGQMVEALNTVVYGGGQGGGMGGIQTPPSMMPPALPDTGQIATTFPMNNAVTQFPMNNQITSPGIGTGPGGNLLDMQSRYDEAVAEAKRQRDGGFMGRVVLPGEMSFDEFSEFNSVADNFEPLQSVGSQPYIGNPIFDQIRAFASGGLASGDGGRERGRGGFQGAGDAGFAGGGNFPSETSGGGSQGSGKDDNEAAVDATLDRIIDQINNPDPDPVINLNQRLAETQLDPMGALAQEVIPSTEMANMGSVMDNVPVQSGYGISPSGTGQDALADLLGGGVKSRAVGDGFTFDNLTDLFELQAMQAASAQDTEGTIAENASDDVVDAAVGRRFLTPGMDGPTPAQLATQSIPDELSGQSPFTSGGVPRPSLFSDESVMRQIMDDDTVNKERPTDLKSLFGEDSETYKNIMERATPIQSDTFPTMAGILGKAMGGANINNIINKINEGGTPILDDGGNIQGVLHDGFFGGTVYSGNEGFNPMAGPKPEREENVLPILPIPEAETPLTVAPPMIDPTLPVTPPNPTDVIVPSTRTDVPVSVPVISPTPIESILPQSLLDLLQARQPVAQMANGGAVLDDAAGRFLEALTAA